MRAKSRSEVLSNLFQAIASLNVFLHRGSFFKGLMIFWLILLLLVVGLIAWGVWASMRKQKEEEGESPGDGPIL